MTDRRPPLSPPPPVPPRDAARPRQDKGARHSGTPGPAHSRPGGSGAGPGAAGPLAPGTQPTHRHGPAGQHPGQYPGEHARQQAEQPRTQPPRPQQKFPPRPLPPGALPRRVDHDGRQLRDEGGGWGVLAYAGIGLLAVALIAGAGIGYLATNPPVDLIQSEITARVKARSGRDLSIGGPTRFTVFPSLGVSMSNVTLSPPPGMTGQPLMTTAGLDVRLKLWPLLSRRIEVEQLVLREPVIELRTDRTGRRTWDVGEARSGRAVAAGPRRIELAQAATPGVASDARPAASAAGRAVAIDEIALQNVRIQNGTVIWHDERSGVRETVRRVNVTTGMRSIASPLELGGSVDLRGELFEVTGSLTSLRTILDQRPAKLELTASGRLATLGFDGVLSPVDGAGAGGADGAINMKVPSVRKLARLAGIELPEGAGGGAGTLSGSLKTFRGGATLEDATLAIDGATAAGNVSIVTAGVRPLLRANLKVSELDLNKYLLTADGASALPAAPAPAPAAKEARSPDAPASIDDLLNRAGPRVKGFTQRTGWSEEPIRTAALGAIDADVKLQLGRLAYRDVRVGQTRMSAALKERVLTATFDDVQLYEGRGRGVVTLDATGEIPRLAANIAADGVAVQPLLKDAARTTWLAGSGKVALAVAGQGGSQKAMMESLAGKADVTFNNGAIVGWNIAQIIRGLKQGQLSGLDRSETAKTDFSELSSTWAIADGVAQNQDLRMTSPLLRVTGAGRVALGARQVDYLLKPRVVASLDGQGGAQSLAGLEVPLRIQGSWDRPEITPEIGDLLKDPDKAIGAIKEIGKQFKGKKPNEIVDQVLGDNPEAAKKVNDLLGKFLKPKKDAPAQ